MISPTLLKSAFYKALMAGNTGPLPEYQPYGVEGAVKKSFDVTDNPPKTRADLADNKARLVIESTGAGKTANYDTHGTVVMRFTAYALANADAGFLAESIWEWLSRVTCDDLPMPTQSVQWINRDGNPMTRYSSRFDMANSSFTATVHLHVPS